MPQMEFALFGLTLAGVAIFHARSLEWALAGLTAIVVHALVAGRSRLATGSRASLIDWRIE